MVSKAEKNRRVETKHLAISYQPTDWPAAPEPPPKTIKRWKARLPHEVLCALSDRACARGERPAAICRRCAANTSRAPRWAALRAVTRPTRHR